ncbi:DUF6879 family protein [Planobispora rosea]|uniref:DUF6879 family protein n=1 Tax=Planobispora rosea TaxID=35762 RepID=UPI00083AB882|nr:DUF6879 family protein [Planobispora rosea]
MSHGRTLTAAEFGQEIQRFEHTAFRLELQAQYLEPEEEGIFSAFLRGETPDAVPVYQAWYDQVAEHVRAGRRIERVRVQQDPPTPYQRFERYLDRWNVPAGEVMRYLNWQRAHDIGLLPAAGDTDWWLLDSERLVVMHFDDEGHRIHNELVTDPEVVAQACTWRDLAVHHSVLASQDAPV